MLSSNMANLVVSNAWEVSNDYYQHPKPEADVPGPQLTRSRHSSQTPNRNDKSEKECHSIILYGYNGKTKSDPAFQPCLQGPDRNFRFKQRKN